MKYETVIGLEVHAQLTTQSKIFSAAATKYGAEPNTQTSIIDLGLPGVLPVLNEKVIEMAVKFGVSINAKIPDTSVFARKNYFYPDLPKGYQISQYKHPIVGQGSLDVYLSDGSTKRIGITRAHLEEDAGKSVHNNHTSGSGIDLNRAGTALLEIVSEPDMRSPEEAIAYLKTLHQLVRYLDICDGNMQEGSFRCDINISLKKPSETKLGTRAEIKNVNSFRFIDQAIRYEIERQTNILEKGQSIIQETRQYDPDKGITRTMRSKEDAHDYRYFPDPDLLPVNISRAFVDTIKLNLPELPQQKTQRYITELNLNEEDAQQITSNKNSAAYFESLIKEAPSSSVKLIANWINGEISATLKKNNMTWKNIPITAERLAPLFDRITDNTLSNTIAKKVFTLLWESNDSVDNLITQHGLKQMSDSSELEAIIKKVITENPKQLEQYKAGKEKLFGYFVGQTMKLTQGKANPKQVNSLLQALLNK